LTKARAARVREFEAWMAKTTVVMATLAGANTKRCHQRMSANVVQSHKITRTRANVQR
jgi:hypothetical protein